MNNPSEIAREALRQLALQRIPPTPDNYRVLYFKISGAKDSVAATGDPVRFINDLVAALPRQSPGEEKLVAQCEQALAKQDWQALVDALAGAINKASASAELRWDKLVGGLIERWDSRLSGLTTAQKKTALDRVLNVRQPNEKLYEKLNSLLTQWSEKGTAESNALSEDPAAASKTATPAASSSATPASLPDETLQDICATLLDTVIASAVSESPSLADDARKLGRELRNLSAGNAEEVISSLRRFAMRVEFFAEDQNELKTGLLHLLQLVVDNIGELVIDDRWLSGQMEILRSIVAGPMSLPSIDNAERRLKEVLFKQSQLKQGLAGAQSTIKTLLAGFVDQLSSFAQSAGAYHDKIDLCAKKIGEAKDIGQLEGVIADVMTETRTIQLTAQRMRDDLIEHRTRVMEAEKKINDLERELAETSEMVRHDQLTGALNRRGLEEVFDKEIARAKRQQSPLCLSVIDIDNFKKLNDSLGHDAGDAALTHLVNTVRVALRPQDTVARFGGEEFVILLPDTALEEARTVVIRVQRELTKHYFLHDNQKILITFSAGVTQLPPDETREQAIKRADELMYQAKNTGKNKVVAA